MLEGPYHCEKASAGVGAFPLAVSVECSAMGGPYGLQREAWVLHLHNSIVTLPWAVPCRHVVVPERKVVAVVAVVVVVVAAAAAAAATD